MTMNNPGEYYEGTENFRTFVGINKTEYKEVICFYPIIEGKD